YFFLSQATECCDDCTAALALDPGRVKALYRRAMARESMGENVEALKDLKKALKLDPTNKQAIASAIRVKDSVAKSAKENSP
ncbi:unnamed protein product, partial [Choristocarpus tenellus]